MAKLLFISLLVFASCATRASEFPDSWFWDDSPQARAPRVLEGKPMPPLKLTGWLNGKVNAAEMKGKIVLVDFYTTWCPTCIIDIPHNNTLFEKFKGKGLVMIGVCTSDEGLEEMPNLVHAKRLKYPTALDPRLVTLKAWHVSMFPTYAFIDRKGIVRAISVKPEHLEAVIEKLLTEKT